MNAGDACAPPPPAAAAAAGAAGAGAGGKLLAEVTVAAFQTVNCLDGRSVDCLDVVKFVGALVVHCFVVGRLVEGLEVGLKGCIDVGRSVDGSDVGS